MTIQVTVMIFSYFNTLEDVKYKYVFAVAHLLIISYQKPTKKNLIFDKILAI